MKRYIISPETSRDLDEIANYFLTRFEDFMAEQNQKYGLSLEA